MVNNIQRLQVNIKLILQFSTLAFATLLSGAVMTMPESSLQTDITVASSTVMITETVSSSTVPLTKKEVKKQLNSGISSSLKVYFKDAPIMTKVAYCESTYTQFDSVGVVHRGVVNNKDVGIFQINEKYHLKDSQKMDIDIYTIEGNMEYARHLYETQGLQPWSASKPCWGKYLDLAIK